MLQFSLKLFILLAYIVTGFFSFYLVVINFLDHIDTVSKAWLIIHLTCATLLTVAGTILFWRPKSATILALACHLGLVTLWINYSGVPFATTEVTSSEPMLQEYYPKAYTISFLLSIGMLFLKNGIRKNNG